MKTVFRIGNFKGFNIEFSDVEVETEMTVEEFGKQIDIITTVLDNLPKYNFNDPSFVS